MSFDSSILKVNCYCGYKTEFDREKQEKIFGDKLLIADISIFYEKLSCLKCKKKYPEILDKNNNIIFDITSTNRCTNCDCLISKPREQILPGTNLCGKTCAEELKLIAAVTQEKILANAYQSYDHKNFTNHQKPPIIDLTNPNIRQVTLDLSARRSEIPKLYNKLINNEIDRLEYQVNFKRFTWWIKESLEKIGGGIHSDPRNYLKCEKCNQLSLINWTNKYHCYFISCSNFSKTKCEWIKNPWFYPDK